MNMRKFWQKIERKKVDPSREQLRNLRHGLVLMPVAVTPRQKGAFPPTMPRQVERQTERQRMAKIAHDEGVNQRRMAGNDRLHRQAAREKSGFYEGTTPLANILGQHFGRMRRQRGDEGRLVRLV